MVKRKPPLTKELIDSLLIVDIEKGSTIWKSVPKNKPFLLNKEAGYVQPHNNGRYKNIKIKIGTTQYRRSHIIWFYATGKWLRDGMEIDHINRNPLDDRFCNLREVFPIENSWNRSSKPGKIMKLPVGVYYEKERKLNPFRACIVVNHKRIYLGVFPSMEDALLVYNNARVKYRGSFE